MFGRLPSARAKDVGRQAMVKVHTNDLNLKALLLYRSGQHGSAVAIFHPRVPLLDNLQNYISMAVQRLIHELKMHPEWNVRHAMEYWKGKMEHMLKSLERCPNVLTIDDFIEGKEGEKIWPGP